MPNSETASDGDSIRSRQRWETAALGDGNMRNLQKGDIIQLERKGYFIVDRPLISASKPLVRDPCPCRELLSQAPSACLLPAFNGESQAVIIMRAVVRSVSLM